MPYTVAEFAAYRGMSIPGAYKAIKRHNIPTYQGVANGKSAQYLSDEDAARLNEILGPTQTHTLILKKSLEARLLEEKDKLDEQHKAELDTEVNKTRTMMLAHVDSGVSEMKQLLETALTSTSANLKSIINEQKKEIKRLQEENQKLKEENQSLKTELKSTQEKLKYTEDYPFKSALSAWNRKKEVKKHGKPSENN